MWSLARRLGAVPIIMAGAMGCQSSGSQSPMPSGFGAADTPVVVRCAYPEEESPGLDARALLTLIAAQTPGLETVRALEEEAAIRRQKAARPGWFKHLSSEERLWIAGAMAQDAHAAVKAAEAIYKAQSEASELLVELRGLREGLRLLDDAEARLKKVLARAENARKASEAAAPLVEAIKADLAGRETARAKLLGQDAAARARIRFLAGIDPAGELKLELPPLDHPQWIKGDLAPESCAEQASSQGPGVEATDTLVATLRDCVGLLSGRAWVGIKPLAEKKVDFQGALYQAVAARRELDAKLRLGAVEAAESISAGTRQAAAAARLLILAQAATRMIVERVEMNAPGFGPKELFEAEGAADLARAEELKARVARHKAHARLWLLVGQP